MKKYLYILIIATTLFSCQDVVEVDLKTAQERLVIEAMIKWQKDTSGNEQAIKLSKTSSFYNNQLVKATGATVSVTNTNTNQIFDFVETEDGLYTIDSFVPELNAIYQLNIDYNSEHYQAEETLFESPEITEITQSTEEGFNTELPEVVVSFNDFQDQDDFYRIHFLQYRPSEDAIIDKFDYTYDSRFESNNTLSDFYESDEENAFQVGDQFIISIAKVSEQFYNFINVLQAQGEGGFGPFTTPPVNVKGNCVNTTKKDHYPYGYFGLNEVSVGVYVFE